MIEMFSVMHGNSVFNILAMDDRSDMVFVWFWNGDDCVMFPKIRYCVSVEGNVVHACEVSNGWWP